MKNRLLMFNTIFMLMFGTLSSCEANKHVLINGERSILLDTNSECKLEIESHFIREAFLIFELSPKGCNLEINNVNEWIDNLTKANGMDSGAIHLSSKIVVSNGKVLISKGEILRFHLVRSSSTWYKGRLNFIFPKNSNMLVNGRPFFSETKTLSLVIGKMRFIF